MSLRRVLFALLLAAPLFEAPGGYDVLRLPAALALGAALLALGPAGRPAPAGLALLGLAGVQLASLAVSPDVPAGLALVLTTAAGAAAYVAARSARREDAVPALSAVALVLLAAAFLRKGSLLGNSNYAGAVAALLLPVLVAAGPRGWAGAAAAAALLGLSESRGGMVGAAAGAAVVALLLRREGRAKEGAAVLVLVLAALALPVALKAQRYVSPERMATAGVRTGIWKGALALAVDRPILGAGAGGFRVLFPPYRSEAEAITTQRDAGKEWKEVEDPHSSWVSAAVEGGIFGAAAWLALLAAAGRRILRAGPGQAGWAGLAVAFFVAGLFNTLTGFTATVVLFGAALGFLEGAPPLEAPRPAAWISAGLLILASLWASTRELQPWRLRFEAGVELDRLGRHREAVEIYRAVAAERPHQAAVLNNLAVAMLRAGEPPLEAGKVLLRAQDVAPHYFMTHFNLGKLLLLEKAGGPARTQFERAVKLNGSHAASRYGVGETYLAEGDVPGALPHLRAAAAAGFDVPGRLRADHPGQATDPLLAEFQR